MKKVFVSWSGVGIRPIALALSEFIPDVIQGTQCFMSASGIDAGTRWAEQLPEELESTDFGVLCLDSSNLNEPWILFEAGAVSKSVAKARVCPYLCGIQPSDLTWPLAQFQACAFDREGTRRLLSSLNSTLGDAKLEEGVFGRSFERCWPEYEKKLEAIASSAAPIESRHRPDRELLEEMLAMLRARTRPQTGSERPKAVVFDVEGGFLAGQRLIGASNRAVGSPIDPVGFLRLTNNGEVGKRFWTVTFEGQKTMMSIKDADERQEAIDADPEGNSQTFEVIDRYEDDLLLYVKIKHVPRAVQGPIHGIGDKGRD